MRLKRIDSLYIPVIIMMGMYIVVFIVFTLGRYRYYNALGWDLGIFSQLTWNASRGHFLQNTVAEYNNMLAVHAPYITILFAPLMWLWPDPQVLLVAQTIILGVGAWPIARLAGQVFRERQLPLFFAALWLLYPALGWMNRWDFHEIAPAATFVAFAFEAAHRRAWRQADFWLVLTLLCKEECGLNVAFFGLYMARQFKRQWQPCTIWFVLGIAWFMIHAFVIFPALRGGGNELPIHAARYTWLIKGDLHSVWNHITQPAYLSHSLMYLLVIFAPLAFISLLAPGILLPALPTFALNLLSSYDLQTSIYMHYNAIIIPSVLVAAIYGLDRWFKKRRVVVGYAMLAATLLMWIPYSPLFGTSKEIRILGWEKGAHISALNEVERLIPPKACVVAENNIEPHFSTRPETYVVGARGAGPVGDTDGCQYMIMDLGDRRYDDYTVGEETACYQFWSQKRTPIYFRDTVVVLQQMPAQGNLEAAQQMEAYCAAYAARH